MIRAPGLLAALGFALTLAGCGERSPAGAPVAANAAANAAAAPRPPAAEADEVRVRLATDAGTIELALDHRHAPVTTENFLRYVDQHRFDGTSFYRASRTRGAPGRGFVQGGIRHDYRRMLPEIAHEPTSRTGLRHVDGTISMARTTPGSAMGDFFIILGSMPAFDAGPRASGDHQGYAAFGHVTAGMDVVRRLLAAATVANAGRGAMRGQMLAAPVRIVSVRRLADAAAR
jgi:peptidyl-prolyl cis-trans isomerase A (cyclophilin A)